MRIQKYSSFLYAISHSFACNSWCFAVKNVRNDPINQNRKGARRGRTEWYCSSGCTAVQFLEPRRDTGFGQASESGDPRGARGAQGPLEWGHGHRTDREVLSRGVSRRTRNGWVRNGRRVLQGAHRCQGFPQKENVPHGALPLRPPRVR